jgi:hypothetical protein
MNLMIHEHRGRKVKERRLKSATPINGDTDNNGKGTESMAGHTLSDINEEETHTVSFDDDDDIFMTDHGRFISIHVKIEIDRYITDPDPGQRQKHHVGVASS